MRAFMVSRRLFLPLPLGSSVERLYGLPTVSRRFFFWLHLFGFRFFMSPRFRCTNCTSLQWSYLFDSLNQNEYDSFVDIPKFHLISHHMSFSTLLYMQPNNIDTMKVSSGGILVE